MDGTRKEGGTEVIVNDEWAVLSNGSGANQLSVVCGGHNKRRCVVRGTVRRGAGGGRDLEGGWGRFRGM